ncbi:hypothetical protein [Devosia chinhatensis]|uniref:hypothetical protein n=1 Tax=Devosia chinhatensis TaxID=429727 RepID=UPI00128DB3D3|nr:hypothetical protein [Devosia chinhatensis]
MKQIMVRALLGFCAIPAALAQSAAPESQLCRAQLELLVSGDKLTADERERFEAQCACLEEREQADESEPGDTCADAA